MSDQNNIPLPEPEPESHADRLMDLALTEKLGGRKPTDVQEKVLAALGPANPAAAPQPARRASNRISWEHYSLLAAVCAGILVTVGMLALPPQYRPTAWITDDRMREPAKLERNAGVNATPQHEEPANAAADPSLDQFGAPQGSLALEPSEPQLSREKMPVETEGLRASERRLRGSEVFREQAGQDARAPGEAPAPYYLKDDVQYSDAIRRDPNSLGEPAARNGERPGGFGGRGAAPAAPESPTPPYITEQYRGGATRPNSFNRERLQEQMRLQQKAEGQTPADFDSLQPGLILEESKAFHDRRVRDQAGGQPQPQDLRGDAALKDNLGNAIDETGRDNRTNLATEAEKRQLDARRSAGGLVPASEAAPRFASPAKPAAPEAAAPATPAPAPAPTGAPAPVDAPRPLVTSVVPSVVPAEAPAASAPARGALPAGPPPGVNTFSGKMNRGENGAAVPAKNPVDALGDQSGGGGKGRAFSDSQIAPGNKPADVKSRPGEPAADGAATATKGAAAATAAPATAPAPPAAKTTETLRKEMDRDAGKQAKDKASEGEESESKKLAEERKPAAGGEAAGAKADDAKISLEKAKNEATARTAVVTWKRAKATPNASQLMVGDHDGLPLVGLQSSVQIDGFRARVVSDYYFYNDKGRRLEGSFKLRLPNEAALYYFAFGETTYKYEPQLEPLAQLGLASADGKGRAAGASPADIFRHRSDSWVASSVKEARMVPREQASYAYAEATRRRVDPALVEWSGAGIFQTRVFPLEAGKLHRIVVGYDVNVAHEGDDLVYRFEVPEDHGQCSVDINLAALPGRTATITPKQDPFRVNNRAFYHFDKIGPDQASLEVRIEKPGTLALTGSDGKAGNFFAAEITPNLGAEGDKASAQVGSEYGLFLLDTSLSSQPDRFNIYLKLLEETLNRNRASLKHFGLLVFNVETHWWQEKYVDNTPENVKAALDYANSLALEGATDLAAAFHEAAKPSWPVEGQLPPADVFLLSDGNATWGELNAHLLTRELAGGSVRSLFAYNSGTSGTAVGLLDHLTRETGGSVFAVTSEEEIVKAATAHTQRPWQLLSVTVPETSDVLVAGRPKTIYAGQRLTVVGRGELKAGGEVILHVKRGDEQKALRTPIDLVVPTDVAARTYGQVATGQLESMASLTQDVAVAYARHFRVTGETCSLLMLESEADYQRYNIKPEDDAFVVKSSPAAELLTKKLDELAKQLVEPKAALMAWLGRLERIPGVNFRMSTALKLALEKMPAESFEVAVPRLECKDRERIKLPQEYLKQLAQQELSYDAVNRDAERRLAALGSADALKAVSSLIEHSPGDMVLTRDVAFSALEWKLGGQAYHLLRRAAMARPYEPQTYLALGRCLAELGKIDLAIVYYETALAGSWDGRFGDFPKIAQVEYLHLLRRVQSQELKSSVPEFAKARFESLSAESGLVGADLVVVVQWNTDRSDVDLHVTEPTGETCKYDHASTAAGGRITRDVTQGFGPEMYTIRQAPAGKYTVAINYYGSDSNRAQARSKIYATVYEYFGTDRERETVKALTLSENKELREVLQVNVKK